LRPLAGRLRSPNTTQAPFPPVHSEAATFSDHRSQVVQLLNDLCVPALWKKSEITWRGLLGLVYLQSDWQRSDSTRQCFVYRNPYVGIVYLLSYIYNRFLITRIRVVLAESRFV
jgi:hypothetical protein